MVGGNQPLALSERGTWVSAITAESPPQSQPRQSLICSLSIPATPLFHHAILVRSELVTMTAIKNPPLSDKLITAFLLGHNQQPYWLRVVENKGPSLTLNRISSETKPGAAIQDKFARNYKQSELLRPILFSKNLLEGSPPGYFLLI